MPDFDACMLFIPPISLVQLKYEGLKSRHTFKNHVEAWKLLQTRVGTLVQNKGGSGSAELRSCSAGSLQYAGDKKLYTKPALTKTIFTGVCFKRRISHKSDAASALKQTPTDVSVLYSVYLSFQDYYKCKNRNKERKIQKREEAAKTLSYGEAEGTDQLIIISCIKVYFQGVYIKDGDDTNWTLDSFWTQTAK